MGKSANISFFLNGQQVPAPIQWRDIGILATFENDIQQANISLENFDFAGAAKAVIDGWVSAGNIFRALPFRIEATNQNGTRAIFEGSLNLANGLQQLPDAGKTLATIEKADGLNRLEAQMEGLTFEYLFQIGEITDADFVEIPYVIDKPDQAAELLSLFVGIAFIAKAVIDEIADLSEKAANTAAHASGGLPGPVAAAIYAVANALIIAAKLAALILLVIEMGRRIINAIIQPVRKHKAMTLQTLLEKAAAHFGRGFSTSLPLANFALLPSNSALDQKTLLGAIQLQGNVERGYPSARDYGYTASQVFELALTYFNARLAIDSGGAIQMHTKGSAYWQRQASYVMPDLLMERIEYNASELPASKLISFQTDASDLWTLSDYEGTAFQIVSSLADGTPPAQDNISGLEEIRMPVGLASRKAKINALENIAAFFANLLDSAVNAFGGNSNLAGSFQTRTGVMRVSQQQHAIPKLVYLEGGQIPANHRQLLSASAAYYNYHAYDSFAINQRTGQKVIYNGRRVGFGLNDFSKLAENRYFYDSDGRLCEALRIEWLIGQDAAEISYVVRMPYTFQVIETYINPR